MATQAGEYNYDATMEVQWPFGFGLSYTTFAYSNFTVNRNSFEADDELIFNVDVTNTGTVSGKESVLLYSSDLIASLTPDIARLRNFDKIELNPGETKTITLKLKGKNLAFVGYDGKWRLEEGSFRMRCGTENLLIKCNRTKVWREANIEI